MTENKLLFCFDDYSQIEIINEFDGEKDFKYLHMVVKMDSQADYDHIVVSSYNVHQEFLETDADDGIEITTELDKTVEHVYTQGSKATNSILFTFLENRIVAADNYMNPFSTKKAKFYSKTRTISASTTANDRIVEFMFTLDTDIPSFERTVYSILDLLSDVGGLFEGIRYIIKIVIFIISFFIQNPFMTYLVRSTFITKDERSGSKTNLVNG